MKSKNNASTPAFPARVLTVLPSRRCSAMNRSASSHVAVHNDPVNERANSMITDRVRLTCLSQSPAAAIANVLVDDLLLEVLDVLSGAQHSGRPDRADHRQAQRTTSSPRRSIHQLYRRTVMIPDQTSPNANQGNNPATTERTVNQAGTSLNEPKPIEIAS